MIEQAILNLRPTLLNIQQNICTRYDDNFSWTCGGCFALAEAFAKSLKKSNLCAVGQFDKESKDWVAQHAFVEFNGNYYDYDGLRTESQLLQYKIPNMGKTKIGVVKTWEKLWYPEQEFVTPKEIQQIKKEFSRLIKN